MIQPGSGSGAPLHVAVIASGPDYRVVPAATFADPEIARVGLNEREARDQGIRYEVTRYALDDLDRAIADGEARGFIKVLTVPGKDRILGATIVGQHAAELLAQFALAMKARPRPEPDPRDHYPT